jgi:hypothetical protein
MNTFPRLVQVCIDVTILGLPEEPGTTEILEFLERPTNVAECFIFLVLPGEDSSSSDLSGFTVSPSSMGC